MADILVNPFYTYTNFTLTDGDPVPDPLPADQASFFAFYLGSAGGGSASGPVESFTITSSPTTEVPVLSLWSQIALAIGLLSVTAAVLRRRFARS